VLVRLTVKSTHAAQHHVLFASVYAQERIAALSVSERTALVGLVVRKRHMAQALKSQHAGNSLANEREQLAQTGVEQEGLIVEEQILVEGKASRDHARWDWCTNAKNSLGDLIDTRPRSRIGYAHLSSIAEELRIITRKSALLANRDREEPRGSPPPTPPHMRITYTAVRRIQCSVHTSTRLGSPSAVKYRTGSAIVSAGL
jgi:hypothetical protein